MFKSNKQDTPGKLDKPGKLDNPVILIKYVHLVN